MQHQESRALTEYSIYDTKASSHKRAKTSPKLCQTVPENLAAPTYPEKILEASKPPHSLEISCGSKTYAQAVMSQKRIFASFASAGWGPSYYCWVQLYSIQLWPRPSSRRHGARAGSSLSDWSEVTQYPISLKQRTRKWHLTAAPSVYVRTPFFFPDRICLNLAR